MEEGKTEWGGWQRRNWKIPPSEASYIHGLKEEGHRGVEEEGGSSRDIDTCTEVRVQD